ncbi:MAG TPA: pitrilysin family protein [Kiritimatiellia bacterium]|nr:pitrilysin family protein [Kiritimatiellia bacterium]
MKMNFRETKLPNGVRVATAHMPSVESVAMGVWVGVGGRYETRRQSGVSHFIEHLLFKGTTSRSARDISQAIEGRGGYFNAFTQEESTCYYARISAEHMWSVLDILSDMYLHPRFAVADINKERGVIIEEIMMYRDQPQHVVQETLGNLLWVDHPLGRPLIGTPENISRMTRDEILRFKRDRYMAGNTMVVLAGKVDHDECVRRVGERMGGVPGRKNPAFEKVGRSTRQDDVSVVSKDIEQTHVAMGIRLFGRRDPRRYALKLMSVILGENMSSRLFQVVREKHGLAYSIHSSTQLLDETGILDVQAGVDCERIPKALEVILAEVNRLKEKPVGASELRRAKDYAIGQMRIGLESTTNQMMWVGEYLMSYGRFAQPAEVIRRVEAVTAEDIHGVARDVLHRRNTSFAMVTSGGGRTQEDVIRGKLRLLD